MFIPSSGQLHVPLLLSIIRILTSKTSVPSWYHMDKLKEWARLIHLPSRYLPNVAPTCEHIRAIMDYLVWTSLQSHLHSHHNNLHLRSRTPVPHPTGGLQDIEEIQHRLPQGPLYPVGHATKLLR